MTTAALAGRTCGKSSTYVAGCRCDPCKAAHSERMAGGASD